ncbi:putative glutamate carboxypeptidase [Lachnellula hyalina]|uniref:Putative glutamate carboxypeptidase n=1 Tax=Lachnellula hyalina TaxID=1316788 RepID=A0A8H8TYM2_9HELO|nr:putative glutamate carboxypeptidase [Lachnellula hyalina]TVY25057.1 putative glutamate carboxypeptidase [Lachnellula hyalina]
MPSDEKPYTYEALPIPTYEEAIGSSSRTSSLNESSEPAEREGLLGPDALGRTPVPTRRAGYRPPPTEESTSNRGSLEQHDAFLGRRESEDSEVGMVRGEIEEMELEEPGGPQSTWGKRISNLSRSLSSIHLPFRWKWRIPDGLREWISLDFNICLILARIFAILLIMGVVYLLFVSGVFTTRMSAQMFDPESVRMYVQSMMDSARIEQHLKVVTQTDHNAGTEGDYVLAQYVEQFFLSNGLEDVKMDEYEVYLNYPKEGGRKVDILGDDGAITWTAQIEEDPVYTDPPRQQTPVFHGLSRAGDVTGPLIYANYGSKEDYKRLYDSGIETKGAIALVRYYGTQTDRAMKVKGAEMAGFAGCIIYSDPADDSQGPPAPNGRALPEDGVQRGSVALTSWIVGDVLTPGWASTKDAERVSKTHNPGLVNIPSIPLSWGDAQKLLQAIQGHGQQVPDEWKGAGVDPYWSGDQSSPKVHLVNEQDENEKQKIWNVMGQITGIEQNEKAIIIGNHRDAWVFGATDPGSGTAVMLEVIHIFGDLMARGWRPLRTIIFASWDAEEYNLIGSTEYVEKNIEQLRKDAFIYINVDVAVGGTEFKAAGSPIFKRALMETLARVSDPIKNETLKDIWENRGDQLTGLGAGSDYVAFQDIAGTSSIDMGFDGDSHYPYHSAYDNFEWMLRVGDPGFIFHNMLAQVWGLLILEFSDKLVMPFDMSAYSASLIAWSMDLENWAESKGANQAGNPTWSTDSLREAVLQFARDAKQFEKWELEWDAMVLGGNGFESNILAAHRKSHNTRMANFETHLLDLEEGGGIPNRTQYKHVVFGPDLWSGYDSAMFPAVRDAVVAEDWALAQQQVEKAAAIIMKASKKLNGNI